MLNKKGEKQMLPKGKGKLFFYLRKLLFPQWAENKSFPLLKRISWKVNSLGFNLYVVSNERFHWKIGTVKIWAREKKEEEKKMVRIAVKRVRVRFEMKKREVDQSLWLGTVQRRPGAIHHLNNCFPSHHIIPIESPLFLSSSRTLSVFLSAAFHPPVFPTPS